MRKGGPMNIILELAGGHRLELAVQPGQTLSQAVYASGLVRAPALCSGLGRCGQCRVAFVRPEQTPPASPVERELLSASELTQGWRLGCRHPVADGLSLRLPEHIEPLSAIKPGPSGPPATAEAANLALDLGSTSLEWEIITPAGQKIAAGRELNPQMGAGGEIMSRLAYAAVPAHAQTMSRLILDRLRAFVRQAGRPIDRLCVAGNPAMLYLMLNLPLTGLSSAPYHLDFKGGCFLLPAPDLPETYIPPLCSAFIGADLTAGLAFLEQGRAGRPAYPYVLADLGTNGECLLAVDPDTYLAASVALGPALEGVGLTFGQTAGPGVIVDYTLSPAGLKAQALPGPPESGRPAETAVVRPGLSGTAYLALLLNLRRLGLLEQDGRFNQHPDLPIAAKVAAGFSQIQQQTVLNLTPDLYLSSQDVEQILKVKAAFNLALSALLAAAGLTPAALSKIYLAGALGEHVRQDALAGLGFVPPGANIEVLGNAALKGAGLLLADPAARTWLERLAPRIKTLNLAGQETFGRQFIDRMVFDYVD